MTIDVSVIIPVFRAEETLARALASIDVPDGLVVEIVLSIDDGQDYSAFEQTAPGVRIVTDGSNRSGPGPTRNQIGRAHV